MNRIRRIVIASAIGLTLAGCTTFEHLTVQGDRFAVASDCGHCHVAITEEWSRSPHALAFTSPDYQVVTNGGRMGQCLPCHVPQPWLTSKKPKNRTTRLQDGVTCTSCHLQDGKMLGPHEPTGAVRPHPIEVAKERFTDSAFCGRCHEGTYQQYEHAAAPGKPACQECHMPAVVRKSTQATGGFSNVVVSMEKPVSARSHTFTIDPALMKTDTLTADMVFANGTATVHLHNHLPHSFPTGDYGVQIGVLDASFLDSDGNVLQSTRTEFIQELKTAIGAGDSCAWTAPVPPSASTLRIEILSRGRAENDSLVLLRREVPVP